jgi:uncharacterized membrane protein SpoIIM required for sporulation/ribosomal protein L40E
MNNNNTSTILANPQSSFNNPTLILLSVLAIIISAVIGIAYVVVKNRQLDYFDAFHYGKKYCFVCGAANLREARECRECGSAFQVDEEKSSPPPAEMDPEFHEVLDATGMRWANPTPAGTSTQIGDVLAPRGNIFTDNYRKCWTSLKSAKKYIGICIALYFGFGVVGFFIPLPPSFWQLATSIANSSESTILAPTVLGTAINIFLHNLLVDFLAILLGCLFGIVPIIEAAGNGFLDGYVLSQSLPLNGFRVLAIPILAMEGVFTTVLELPAHFISYGIGIWLAITLVGKQGKFKVNLLEAFRVLASVVAPLLFAAALFEASFLLTV